MREFQESQGKKFDINSFDLKEAAKADKAALDAEKKELQDKKDEENIYKLPKHMRTNYTSYYWRENLKE